MRHAVAFTSLLLVAACGFHLRGNLDLPPAMASTYIAFAGSDAELRRSIARALVLSDVKIAGSEAEADAVLDIVSATVGQRVLSKDSSGRPREYEVKVQLVYRVRTAREADAEEARAVLPRVIVPVQRVERRGNVVLDPEQPLANAGDVSRAVTALREEAVWDMLHRIAATDLVVEGGTRDEVAE